MVEPGTTSGPAGIEVTAENGGRRGIAASIAGIGAALLASLCCIGPVLFVTFGVGAGLASRFEPLRPLFTVATVALIGAGFYVVYGRRAVGGGDPSCRIDGSRVVPRKQTRDKLILWIATAVALLLLTFPQWSRFLLR